ncbi:10 TM acyl transferase domain found in Cas1p-domain-containing protein [Ilyonectria destructans]|nr:10 TM acyl transferase domain found in Cas1p-domain-containing protein [Ilyonectria destructans]
MIHPQLTLSMTARLLSVSFAIILVLAIIFESLSTSDDPHRCRAILEKGSWIHEPDEHGDRKPFTNWQPDGCMMRTYTKEDIQTCFGNRHLLFSGDSTTRQVFWGMARLLEPEKAKQGRDHAEIHSTYDMTFGGVRMKQIWNPYFETGERNTNLTRELQLFAKEKHNPVPIEEQKSAALIMLGAGSWYVLSFKEPDSLTRFQSAFNNITDILRLQDLPTFGTSPMDPIDGVGNELFVAPVAVPFYDELPAHRTGPNGIHKGEVEAIDEFLVDVSAKRNFPLINAFPELSHNQPEAMVDRFETGFHVIDSVAEIKAQILLNMRCNAKLDKLQGYPYNRTCCTDYGSPTWIQIIVLGVAVLYVILCTVLDIIDIFSGSESTRSPILSLKVGIFAVALLFCYFADRTQLFAKGNKEFVMNEFLILLAVSSILALVTIRKTQPRQARTPAAPVTAAPVKEDAGILSRDQTEEWKGWMQAVILVYHWTGASTHLGIYMFVRLLVASYLFQTGYGHTIYFLSKNDFSFRRVAAVMLRMNILSCALPYVMNTNYMFYYFAPLVSYWFIIVYLTMAIGSKYNDNSTAVLCKITVALLLNLGITRWTPVTKWVFSILEAVFRIEWDLHEWEFRASLDGVVVFVGMLAGLVQQRVARDKSWLTNYKTAIVPALFSIAGYCNFAYHFEAKQDYNWFHSFVSFLPILGFIALRNCFTPLRNYYSTASAWLGRCSLETFVLQYHIYLASDTKGVLLLDMFRGGDGSLLGDRWRDLVVIVPVFIWLSHCVAEASGIIVKLMTDKPKESDYDEEDEELKIVEPAWGGYSLLQGHSLDRATRVVKAVGSDLRIHVAAMLGAMWLLNWLY